MRFKQFLIDRPAKSTPDGFQMEADVVGQIVVQGFENETSKSLFSGTRQSKASPDLSNRMAALVSTLN